MHPRIQDRLNETLAARLKDIDAARRRVRELMTDVRRRIDYLESAFGLPLDECRTECDDVLRQIEELGSPILPTQEEIEALIQKVIRLSAKIGSIDSACFRLLPRDDGAPGAP